MKTPMEHLRNLSAIHRKRVEAANEMADKMKRAADAAQTAKETEESAKG